MKEVMQQYGSAAITVVAGILLLVRQMQGERMG